MACREVSQGATTLSILESVFGADTVSIPPEGKLSEQVDKTIQDSVYKCARSLLVEIEEEMDMENTALKIDVLLEMLKDKQVLITKLHVATNREVNSTHNIRKKLLLSKERLYEEMKILMTDIKEIKEKYDELKEYWEFFRKNYKEKAIEAVKRKCLEMRDEIILLEWSDFLPRIRNEETGETRTLEAF